MSTSRPLHGKTIDDITEKPLIKKFCDFIEGGTDTVDQLNNYYTTQAKSCSWVMMSLFYMLDTSRVNEKTTWFLQHKEDISKFSSYDFG